MKLYWYAHRFVDVPSEKHSDGTPVIKSEITHGAVDAGPNQIGELVLDMDVHGVCFLQKDAIGEIIESDEYRVVFSDVDVSKAYRHLLDYIYSTISLWNGALVALENSLTFERMGKLASNGR